MNSRWPTVCGVVLGVAILPAGRTAPPAIAQTEIIYLLQFIESSGCEFYRNGSWYDSKQAQAHMRDKYDLLAGANRINTAEEFIEQAATKSSLTGHPYQVKCNGAGLMTSSQWLRAALARRRSSEPHETPRGSRGALGPDASGVKPSAVGVAR